MMIWPHPAGGYFEFVIIGNSVALRCHWPVDLADDEWIDIENHYDVAGYLQAVDDAISTGDGKARGIDGGYLRITSVVDGFAIEFSRPQSGWSARSLRLRIGRPIAELLPRPDRPGEWVSINQGRARQVTLA
jgi:hypothetical protein